MALSNLRAWAARADVAVQEALRDFESRTGFAPEGNTVRLTGSGGAAATLQFPEALQVEAFFAVIDEVSWPDIWNGYFLGPARDVREAIDRSDPARVRTAGADHLAIAIGSDGGGSRFVVDLERAGEVLWVRDAFVDSGVLTGTACAQVGVDLDEFLEGLLYNVQRVTAGLPPAF